MIGRVIDKGLAGPTEERAALFVDGVDGRLRRIEVSLQAASGVPLGAVVQAGVGPTIADLSIAVIAKDGGIYRADEHLRRLQMGELPKPRDADPADIVASHERRLEALRRAHIVERYEQGRWGVPQDFLQKASDYEGRRGIVRVLSPIDLERQVNSPGATWLDRQLVSRQPLELANNGFGLDVKAALERRTEVLESRGLTYQMGQEVMFLGGMLQTLASQELAAAGEQHALKTGKSYWSVQPGQWVMGTYAGRLELDSGPFAILEEEHGFRLIPWRPVIEPKLGLRIEGLIERGGGVSWDLSRKPDRELGLDMTFDDGLAHGLGRGLGLGR